MLPTCYMFNSSMKPTLLKLKPPNGICGCTNPLEGKKKLKGSCLCDILIGAMFWTRERTTFKVGRNHTSNIFPNHTPNTTQFFFYNSGFRSACAHNSTNSRRYWRLYRDCIPIVENFVYLYQFLNSWISSLLQGFPISVQSCGSYYKWAFSTQKHDIPII